MIELWVTAKPNPVDSDDWSGTAQLLYCDPVRPVLWVWFSPGKGEDLVGVRNPRNDQLESEKIVPLGRLDERACYGSIGYIHVEDHDAWESIRTEFTQVPLLKAGALQLLADKASLREVLGDPVDQEHLDVVVHICETASVYWHLMRARPSFEDWLRETEPRALLVTAPDLVEVEVPREQRLFEEVVARAERRRVLFLFGGARSGLDTFVRQLRDYLVNEGKSRRSYYAAFVGKDWDEIYRHRIRVREIRRADSPADRLLGLKALLAAVALSGYRALRSDPHVDRAALDKFTAGDHRQSAKTFADVFLHHITLSDSAEAVFDDFLGFLGRLLTNAAASGSFAVMLPFDSLTDLLFSPRAEETTQAPAPEVIGEATASFIQALQDFGRGISANGGRPNSPTADKSTSTAGIPSPAITPLAEGRGEKTEQESRIVLVFSTSRPDSFLYGGWHEPLFTQQTVLAVPPFAESEITMYLVKILRRSGLDLVPSPAIARQVREITGGAPWFVYALMRCLSDQLPNSGMSEEALSAALRSAGQFLRRILEGPADGGPAGLQEEVETYRDTVRSLLEPFRPAEDGKIKGAWYGSVGKTFDRNILHRLGPWLSTGLVWLSCPAMPGVGPLDAFANFPSLYPYPATILCRTFLASIETSPASRVPSRSAVLASHE